MMKPGNNNDFKNYEKNYKKKFYIKNKFYI